MRRERTGEGRNGKSLGGKNTQEELKSKTSHMRA